MARAAFHSSALVKNHPQLRRNFLLQGNSDLYQRMFGSPKNQRWAVVGRKWQPRKQVLGRVWPMARDNQVTPAVRSEILVCTWLVRGDFLGTVNLTKLSGSIYGQIMKMCFHIGTRDTTGIFPGPIKNIGILLPWNSVSLPTDAETRPGLLLGAPTTSIVAQTVY